MDRKELAKRFGGRLRALRKEAGLTQAQLAARTEGVYPGDVSRFETGARTPNLRTMAALARGLGVEAAVLVAWEEREVESGLEEVMERLRGQPVEVIRRVVEVVEVLVRVG